MYSSSSRAGPAARGGRGSARSACGRGGAAGGGRSARGLGAAGRSVGRWQWATGAAPRSPPGALAARSAFDVRRGRCWARWPCEEPRHTSQRHRPDHVGRLAGAGMFRSRNAGWRLWARARKGRCVCCKAASAESTSSPSRDWRRGMRDGRPGGKACLDPRDGELEFSRERGAGTQARSEAASVFSPRPRPPSANVARVPANRRPNALVRRDRGVGDANPRAEGRADEPA